MSQTISTLTFQHYFPVSKMRLLHVNVDKISRNILLHCSIVGCINHKCKTASSSRSFVCPTEHMNERPLRIQNTRGLGGDGYAMGSCYYKKFSGDPQEP